MANPAPAVLGLVTAIGCGTSSDNAVIAGAASDHHCIVLPGSWSHATRSFAIRSGPVAGQLDHVSEVRRGVWHQRAAVHPDGGRIFVSASVTGGDPVTRGIYVYAYGFDTESCAIGALLDSVTADTDTASIMRYYGLEMHPSGRYLYQTTESVQEIRVYGVADDGTLSLVQARDVTLNGTQACAQTRRLELHSDGRTLYSNCNNSAAGDRVDSAVQAWRVEDDGRLEFLGHYTAPGMTGVFDPSVHPNGRWLYQPGSGGSPGTHYGNGAIILLYDIAADGQLAYRSSMRVIDPDADSLAPMAELPFTSLPTTVLIHPDGTHAYVTLHDQINVSHHVVQYRIDQDDGTLEPVSTINTTTTGTGNHHGGVLARRDGRTFLYTFINVFPGPEGFVEQFEITGGYGLRRLDPPVVAAGLVDARHPIAVARE